MARELRNLEQVLTGLKMDVIVLAKKLFKVPYLLSRNSGLHLIVVQERGPYYSVVDSIVDRTGWAGNWPIGLSREAAFSTRLGGTGLY
jgi:hypothetical protein